MVVELDGAPQRSPRHGYLKIGTCMDQYNRQAIEPSFSVLKHQAISAERGLATFLDRIDSPLPWEGVFVQD